MLTLSAPKAVQKKTVQEDILDQLKPELQELEQWVKQKELSSKRFLKCLKMKKKNFVDKLEQILRGVTEPKQLLEKSMKTQP